MIQVKINKAGWEYDIHSLVKAFYPEETVKVLTPESVEKKLAEDKPQWRQFICLDAFDSEVCKNYGINAIPRFLFFDKDGKVISLDAPRPSSAKITEYIDRHIR